MALGALASQLPLVRIRVAGSATRILEHEGISFFPWHGIGRVMASLTIGDFFVQAGQRVTGFAMREFFQVPFDQVEIFALMFRMAGDAFTVFFSVPSASGFDAFRQVPVTDQAFQGVGFFLFRMAFRAIGHTRQMRVELAELPWRNQQIDFLAAEGNSRKICSKSGRQQQKKQSKLSLSSFRQP